MSKNNFEYFLTFLTTVRTKVEHTIHFIGTRKLILEKTPSFRYHEAMEKSCSPLKLLKNNREANLIIAKIRLHYYAVILSITYIVCLK